MRESEIKILYFALCFFVFYYLFYRIISISSMGLIAWNFLESFIFIFIQEKTAIMMILLLSVIINLRLKERKLNDDTSCRLSGNVLH